MIDAKRVKKDMLKNVLNLVSAYDELEPIVPVIMNKAKEYADSVIPELVDNWYELAHTYSGNETELHKHLNEYTENFYNTKWNPKISSILINEYKRFKNEHEIYEQTYGC